MGDINLWAIWLRATLQHRSRARGEAGFTALEWLFVALGVITIAGIAVAAVQAYVTGQTHKLGKP